MKLAIPILLLLGGEALADDRADADRLFTEGRALIDAGKPDAACGKFRQSFAKDPHALGTLLNLGLCAERQGLIATAVLQYRAASALAVDAKAEDSHRAAEERLAILVPLLPQLVITAPSRVDGEVLRIDGIVTAIDTLPVDPGTHAIELSAPGHTSYTTSVRVEIGKRVELALPALEASRRKLIGKIAMASGGGLFAIGAVALAVAKSHYDKPFDAGECSHDTLACTPSGQAAVDSARHLGTFGSVVGIVGLGALAAGAALYFTAPHETALVPTGSGLALVGRF